MAESRGEGGVSVRGAGHKPGDLEPPEKEMRAWPAASEELGPALGVGLQPQSCKWMNLRVVEPQGGHGHFLRGPRG